MANPIRNIFISHVHEDDSAVMRLKKQLINYGLDVRDSSVTSEKPNDAESEEYIKYQILGPRIKWAGCVIVYISHLTTYSKWVEWEIDYADGQEKHIVGVWEPGASSALVPRSLYEYADAVIGWDGWDPDRIIKAINGECDDFDVT